VTPTKALKSLREQINPYFWGRRKSLRFKNRDAIWPRAPPAQASDRLMKKPGLFQAGRALFLEEV
jgi:hypothetical protein